MTTVEERAELLDRATATGQAIPQLTSDGPMSLDTAYAVQHAGIALREGRGETVAGVKLGFTSKAKAEQMGVSDVIIGSLTDRMRIEDGGTFDVSRGVHPRVEPEVAFRLGPDGEPAAVAPALEIIDSRYRDFKFSLADVVADNTSASAFVIGPWTRIDQLAALAVDLLFDGEVVASGSTADILGDPLRALPAAQRMAAAYGHRLGEGSVLLAGAATAAVALKAGTHVEARVAGLGSVSVRTKEG
ncbi:4-oxalocrotonate decarboxylase [Amycolatopsis sp. AA4]|uniref:2-keto-4-pentenoate hydratase n=1 Tax=Actinomycetes TaxID=1760 RepID=UPI0001B5504D|nr:MULTISPECIES: fumarylacetoacetate hydrolase family protein [Actinomycetes]ATY12087.1 4-oxalocrotonate decarboxylase [Amycolatopsis sp. AA4]